MLSIAKIKDKYGDNICRRCINRKYRANLQPRDCQYGYTYVCPVCHKMHNIVVGFNMSGHGKLLFK